MDLLPATRPTPHRHWRDVLFVVGAPLAFFFIDRLVALPAILDVFAAKHQRSFMTQAKSVLLGVVQDLLVVTLLVAALLFVEAVASIVARVTGTRVVPRAVTVLSIGLRVVVVFGLVVLTLAPFAADMLLLRTRSMRFTTELLATYQRERDQAATLEVEPREVRLAIVTCVAVAVFAGVFTGVYVRWIDLRRALLLSQDAGTEPRRRFHPIASSPRAGPLDDDLERAVKDKNSDERSWRNSPSPDEDDTLASSTHTPHALTPTRPVWKRLVRTRRVRIAVALVAWLVLFLVTRTIAVAASPAVAAIALNATLNELVRNLFHVQFLRGSGSGAISWGATYLNSATEDYDLFQDGVLYRKTTGFKGPLAFDVEVQPENPPNVLVLAVESFRYMDSLLMAADTAAGALMQKHNLTVTPQFDRWAQRGVAFSNMWSSWQTSRSLEAILFGQVAYDSVSDSGTTRGRKDTKLVGMPQLFKQKGYETVFTTGCIVTYDQWDKFLPSHGFEELMAAPEMKTYAQEHYNITTDDWEGPAHRGFNWGVHDDVSFDIVGDMMINKTTAQAERVKRGEPKKPFFLNHYTISSHHTFEAHPAWLDKKKLPDFSPLCEGFESQCDLIKKYAKLRYFTDMELGKFLDRMKTAGVLDDTIVVIVGDHGQSPEMGLATPFIYQTAVTHVASTLIAEGRLGKYVGLVVDDATHHYDLLNTLADIVGVPTEGFLQTGVGRSLKRKIPFGERLVWSNNPMKKMAVVRGHQRFVYDRTSDDMGLYDTVQDPLETNDLLPSLTEDAAAEWHARRDAGRELNAYFKRRWDHKCLAMVACAS